MSHPQWPAWLLLCHFGTGTMLECVLLQGHGAMGAPSSLKLSCHGTTPILWPDIHKLSCEQLLNTLPWRPSDCKPLYLLLLLPPRLELKLKLCNPRWGNLALAEQLHIHLAVLAVPCLQGPKLTLHTACWENGALAEFLYLPFPVTEL